MWLAPLAGCLIAGAAGFSWEEVLDDEVSPALVPPPGPLPGAIRRLGAAAEEAAGAKGAEIEGLEGRVFDAERVEWAPPAPGRGGREPGRVTFREAFQAFEGIGLAFETRGAVLRVTAPDASGWVRFVAEGERAARRPEGERARGSKPARVSLRDGRSPLALEAAGGAHLRGLGAALGTAGPMEALVRIDRLLAAADPATRAEGRIALLLLARREALRAGEPIPGLDEALEGRAEGLLARARDPEARAAGVLLSRRYRGRPSYGDLQAALGDPEPRVAEAGLLAFEGVPLPAGGGSARRRPLRGMDAHHAIRAVKTLAERGGPLQRPALMALASKPDPGVAYYLLQLAAERPAERVAILGALSVHLRILDAPRAEIVRGIELRVRDAADRAERQEAEVALAALASARVPVRRAPGPAPAPAVPPSIPRDRDPAPPRAALLAALRGGSLAERLQAVRGLGRLVGEDEAARALGEIARARDAVPALREEAIGALAAAPALDRAGLGPAALPGLLADERNEDLRRALLSAAARAGGAAGMDLVCSEAGKGGATGAWLAALIESLSADPSRPAGALRLFRAAAGTSDPAARRAALVPLGALDAALPAEGRDEIRRAALRSLADPETYVRTAAASGLEGLLAAAAGASEEAALRRDVAAALEGAPAFPVSEPETVSLLLAIRSRRAVEVLAARGTADPESAVAEEAVDGLLDLAERGPGPLLQEADGVAEAMERVIRKGSGDGIRIAAARVLARAGGARGPAIAAALADDGAVEEWLRGEIRGALERSEPVSGPIPPPDAARRAGAVRDAAAAVGEVAWVEPDPARPGWVWVGWRDRFVGLDRPEKGLEDQSLVIELAVGGVRQTTRPLFDGERVLVGTDRGLFAFDRAREAWVRLPLAEGSGEAPVIRLGPAVGGFSVAVEGRDGPEAWRFRRGEGDGDGSFVREGE